MASLLNCVSSVMTSLLPVDAAICALVIPSYVTITIIIVITTIIITIITIITIIIIVVVVVIIS